MNRWRIHTLIEWHSVQKHSMIVRQLFDSVSDIGYLVPLSVLPMMNLNGRTSREYEPKEEVVWFLFASMWYHRLY